MSPGTLALTAVAVLLAACAPSPRLGPVDAAAEALPDAVAEAPADLVAEAPADVVTEASADVAAEAAPGDAVEAHPEVTPCGVGANQTCNDNLAASAIWGTCVGGACQCNSGFSINPATGRCRPGSP